MNFLKRFQFARDSYLITALVIATVLMLNFVASRHFFKIDLSRHQLYSLSVQSKEVLRHLDDIVTVKLFFTNTLPPNLFSVRQYLDDLLDEMTSYSNGKLLVQSYNPSDPDVANEALKLGLPAVQMNIVEEDKLEVKNGFLGLVVLYGDKKETLPVIQNSYDLEYSLIAAIKKVTSKEDKIVGIVTGHGEPTLEESVLLGEKGDSLSLFKKALDRNYQVLPVSLNSENSLRLVNTLLLIGSKQAFSASELSVLDQFINKGGNLVIFLDSIDVDQSLQASVLDLNLADFLSNYGVEIESALVLDRSNENASFSQGSMNFIMPYPFWVKAITANFSSSSPIVNQLDSIVFPWTSPLRITSVSNPLIKPLIKTSTSAWRQTDPFTLLPDQIQASTAKKQMILALHIKETTSATSKTGQFFVVGNSRFVTDRFVTLFPQNLVFAMNAVDDLTLDQSLIGIRSKAAFDLPLNDLSATERQAVKFFGIFLMPFVVILYGALRSFARKRKSLIP